MHRDEQTPSRWRLLAEDPIVEPHFLVAKSDRTCRHLLLSPVANVLDVILPERRFRPFRVGSTERNVGEFLCDELRWISSRRRKVRFKSPNRLGRCVGERN
jgi:hypothetical protein